MGTFTFQNICHLFSFHERMLNLCKYIKCSTLDFPHDMGVVNQCDGIYALVCWDISCSHLSTSLNTQRMTNNLPVDDTEYGLKYMCYPRCFTLTSEWARWRLRSPASRLCTQLFIQTQIKENTKAPRHWPLCGEFTVERWIPHTKGQ